MSEVALPDHKVEGYKILFDTFKHLTTLSTGSILLLVTVLKDLFKTPEWSVLIAVTLIMFLISTLASLIVMLAFGDTVYGKGEFTVPYLEYIVVPSIIISAVAFISGLIVFVIFVLKNIY